MPELVVSGCTIHYEERGRGVPVVLTPGGRWGGYVQRVVAAELAKDFRVITWDRPTTDGASGLMIGGDMSEAELWADTLAGLIRGLKLAPCYIGEYAGCRTTPLVCLKYPDLVKGLLLAWPSGGEVPANSVPRNMYQPYIRAALREGMEAVTRLNHFAESIRQNPANRDALLAMDRMAFIRQMSFWAECFMTTADLPIAGCWATDADWASIKVPAIITGGCDPVHPTAAAQRLHRLLPNARYHDPVVTPEEWDRVFGKNPYPVTSDFQGERIAPVWRAFLKQNEG